jgi:hypothetical protein
MHLPPCPGAKAMLQHNWRKKTLNLPQPHTQHAVSRTTPDFVARPRRRPSLWQHILEGDLCVCCPGQAQAKALLKRNWRKIARVFLEASIYCTLYHHFTQEVKKRTKKRRLAAFTDYAPQNPKMHHCFQASGI